MNRRCAYLTLAALLATALPAQAQQKYDIKFRKSVQGDVTLGEKNSGEDLKVQMLDKDGKVAMDLSKGKKGDHSVFRETVVAKAPGAERATKLTRAYSKAEVTDDGNTTALPYQGKTVVIEKKDGKYRFQVEGGAELTGKDADLLDKEFNTPTPKFNPEKLLPGKAVAVGEAWKIDPAVLLDDMKKSGADMEVDRDKSVTTGKLLKAYKKDGRQFGAVRFEMVLPLKSFGAGGQKFPLTPGDKLVVLADYDGCIDGGANVGMLSGQLTFEMHFTPPGQDQKFSMKMRATMFEQAKLPAK